MKAVIYLAVGFYLFGCNASDETKDHSAIATDTDVLDVRITSAQPNKSYAKEDELIVGFDDAEEESRMLLYFPKIKELYDEKVILSSIAEIEVVIQCEEVAVNPDFINLQIVSEFWLPNATWSSPIGLSAVKSWQMPGGSIDEDYQPIHPSIRKNDDVPGALKLSFDLTEVMTAMVFEDQQNFGFLVTVEKSDYNSEDRMYFKTSNSGESTSPAASLIFTSEDDFE